MGAGFQKMALVFAQWAMWMLIVCAPAIAFAANSCPDLFSENTSQAVFLRSILGTSNKNFNPKANYVERFTQELLSIQPQAGNFKTVLGQLRQARVEIAKANRGDKDLYDFLTSPEATKFSSGKSGDSTNVTALYSAKDYGDMSARYQVLYDKVNRIYQEGRFKYDDNSEISLRYAKATKQKHKTDDSNHWLLNYETLYNGQTVLVSGIIAKTSSYADPLFGIYNSFSRDIPVLLKQIEFLWDRTLQAKSQKESAERIAEFEWFFFHVNPLGRAAASIGDVMSLSLQMATHQTLRQEFVHLDFEALIRSRTEYLEWRVPQMLNP